MSSTSSHEAERSRSYRNLEAAREKAAVKNNFDSIEIRTRISNVLKARFGSDPHSWQLDVTEALLLGLDCVVIAGTGSGKTMPFMMPLLLDEVKKTVIISPLKILQEDQAERFQKMQLPTAAVNGDTWSSDLQKDLKNGAYRGILTSPEMCLKHEAFRELLTGTGFLDICMLVLDEAHCVQQWGPDFRPTYAEVGKLCAFFPSTCPTLATSATLTPSAADEVCSKLGIDRHESFFLNLGNDRPNIAYSALPIDSSTDYKALKPLLSSTPNPTSPDDLIKSIVFVNSVNQAQHTARTVRTWLPKRLRSYVGYIHAHRSPKARRKVMRRFRQGKIKVLIATEAAGMGADIPDIEQVIQFGVPSSLSVWIQRAGRAGRSSNINARAILLYEKSMLKKKKTKRKKPTADEEEDEGEGEGEDDGGTATEWCKKVDDNLRRWITTKACRRDVVDEYFNNPPNRKAPTHICCDNCEGNAVEVDTDSESDVSRPSTPISTISISPHSSPSKSVDENGKRKMATKPPQRRYKEHLQNARNALLAWRFNTKRSRYTPSPVTADVLLPDEVVKKLASSRSIQTVEDIQQATGWTLARRHGEDVLQVLKRLDAHHYETREKAKQARAEERKAATAQRNREKRELELKERADRIRQRDEDRLRQALALEEENRVKADLAARKKAEKEAAQSARVKRTPRQPLAGCSTFNIGTPSVRYTPQPPSSSSSSTSVFDLRTMSAIVTMPLHPTSRSTLENVPPTPSGFSPIPPIILPPRTNSQATSQILRIRLPPLTSHNVSATSQEDDSPPLPKPPRPKPRPRWLAHPPPLNLGLTPQSPTAPSSSARMYDDQSMPEAPFP